MNALGDTVWRVAGAVNGPPLVIVSQEGGCAQALRPRAGWLGLAALVAVLLLSGCARLPQDQGTVVWMSNATGNYDLWAVDSGGHNVRPLTTTPDLIEAAPAWTRDGTQLAFHGFRSSGSELYVLPITGTASLAQPVGSGATDEQSDGDPSWSPDGRQLVFVSDRGGNRDLYMIDADGQNLRQLTRTPEDEGGPDWSPDGASIVFHRFSSSLPAANLFALAPVEGTERQLTNLRAMSIEPAWSPDGERIAFMSNRDGGEYELYMMDPDGRNQIRLTRTGWPEELPAWSPNSEWLVYAAQPDPLGDFDLYVLHVDGDRKAQPLVKRPGDDRWPAWR